MIFVGQQTWFAVSLLVVVAFLTFEFQMVTAYSYLPELTPDERELRDFTRNFTTAAFCFAVAYVAVIVGVSGGLHRASDAVWVAKLSMSLTFVVAALFLGMAWLRGFKPRPPLRRLSDEGGAPRSVWTAGFVKLGGSIKLLASTPQYRPLLWFNLAIAFCDAALQSLPTILITLLSDQLGFTSAEIGASVLVLLLAIAPAGFLSAYATKRLGNDAVRSSLLALLVLAATTAAAAIVLTPDAGPAQAYALVAFWGVGNGWKWTCDRLASGTLCPPSQSGEFMGLYLFSTIVLTWLPPLVFTILNESGAGMRVGLATLDVWFVLSASMYLCMGSYRDAVASMASAVPPSPPSSSLDRGDQEEDDDECALPPPPEEAPPPAEADAVTDMVEIELTETSPAK
jgi:MFS-type transporter involved in bile tolerance (Atg22 family)